MAASDPRFPAFLDVVRQVSVETERHLREPYSYLMAIDQLFVDWIPAAGRIKPPTVSVLILNAHAAFRAGLSLALSGQLLPVFMALRGALESALYANAISHRPDMEKVWLNRDRDEDARKVCRGEFTIKKMIDSLAKVQDPEFAEAVRDAYDSTIDFGAHPNSRSMLRSVAIAELKDGSHALNFAYVHGPESFEIRQAFVACADIGHFSFLIALIASNGHPDVETLNARALSLRDNNDSFIKSLGLDSSSPRMETTL